MSDLYWLTDEQMARFDRTQIEQLYSALQDDLEEKRLEAAEIVRTLVDHIVVTPNDAGVELDVQGDLAGILQVAASKKAPVSSTGAFSARAQLQLVAGTRNTRCLRSPYFRLIERNIPKLAA